jgi:signal transduction histidine kinase/CheY-like chemotaxis protein
LSDYLTFLAECLPDFLASDDPSIAFDVHFARLAVLTDLAGYEWYAVNDRQELTLVASRGIAEPVGERIALQVVQQCQPVFHPDIRDAISEASTPLREGGITGCLGFPLIQDGTLLGALLFVTRRRGGWTQEAGTLLQIVSGLWSASLRGEKCASVNEPLTNDQVKALQQSVTRLRALAAEQAVNNEQARRQIAEEVDNHLSKPLALGRMKLGHVIRQTTTASINRLLEDVDEVMDGAVKFVETFTRNLTPPVLHEQGFQPALHWLASRMEKEGLTVALRLPPRAPVLHGHQAILLYQSVRELLFNVRKHAGTKRATVNVAYDSPGHLRISVEDDGRGFHLSEVAKTDERHRRFGLFSIKECVTMLNGRMEIHSLPEQGTRVTLIVPTQPAPMADQDEDLDGRPEKTTERLRVLLVDDHAMVREGLRSILEGYHDLEVVGEAGDGIEAVKLARTRRPDVVVMDINMPRLDGVSATRQIKHDLPSTAVIGISVQDSSQVEQAMISAGATTFLRKDRAASHLHDAILHAH